MANVRPAHLLIPACRRDEISSRSEALPDEISLALTIDPSQVNHALALGELTTRQRYRARSLIGWQRFFRRPQPNAAHHALGRLEQQGKLSLLLTQNADRRHQAAGREMWSTCMDNWIRYVA